MKSIKSASLALALLLGLALFIASGSPALAAVADINGEYRVMGTDSQTGETGEISMPFVQSGTKVSMESDGIKFDGTYDPATGKASLQAPVPNESAMTFALDVQFVEDKDSISMTGTLSLMIGGKAEQVVNLKGDRVEG